MRFQYFVALALLVISARSSATEDMIPPINESSLNGVWEAVSETSVTVYMMDINPKGKSILVASHSGGIIFISKLQKKFIKNGDVNLVFSDKESTFSIRGKGYADQTGGIITARMIVNGLSDTPSKLIFHKPGLTQEWFELANAARREIEKNKIAK